MASMNEALRKAREIALKLSGAPARQQRAPKCATSANMTPLGKRRFPGESSNSIDGSAGDSKKSKTGGALFFESRVDKVYVPVEARPDIKWIGLIVGPRGSTIRRIQEESKGCTLRIRGRGSAQDGSKDNDPEPLHIVLEGNSEQIKGAKELVEALFANPDQLKSSQLKSIGGIRLPNEGDPSEEMFVPNNVVGFVIGRGGETIREIQAMSGASIQMQREIEMAPGQTERRLTMRGPPAAIQNAKEGVNRAIAEAKKRQGMRNRVHSSMVSKQARIPDKAVGFVIGKGGCTIRGIREKSRTKINIPSEPDLEDPVYRTITISGETMDDCELAETLVAELLGEHRKQTEGRLLGSSGQGGGGAAAAAAGATVTTLQIPDVHVGAIIGQKGRTIKRLEYTYHVKIQIPPAPVPGSRPPHRDVELTGLPAGTEACRAEIANIVGQYSMADANAIGGGAPQQFSGHGAAASSHPNLDPRNPYAAQWAAYYAAQSAAETSGAPQPAAGNAAGTRQQPSPSDSASTTPTGVSTNDPNLDPRNPYAAQWAAYYAAQAASKPANPADAGSPSGERKTDHRAEADAASPEAPRTAAEATNSSAGNGAPEKPSSPSDPNLDPRNPYAAQWAAFYAAQSAEAGGGKSGGVGGETQQPLDAAPANGTRAGAATDTGAATSAPENSAALTPDAQGNSNPNLDPRNPYAAQWAAYYAAQAASSKQTPGK